MEVTAILMIVLFIAIFGGIITFIILRKLKGSIKIIFDKQSNEVHSGENIIGKLEIKVKKPLLAEKITLSIIPKMKQSSFRRNSYKQQNREMRPIYIQTVLTNQQLNVGINTLDFTLNVPEDLDKKLLNSNPIMKTLMMGLDAMQNQWTKFSYSLRAQAYLEGIDIVGQIPITISA
ncbi:hypothetical protein HN604_00645 [archaeon]|jgi:hypothetical protein|nr:hypothetical protein [archaeon]MBT6182329.1 hypothetical protein [archaeon]MBT6606675.1 hypothetical protein [archaeon]MBT7251918.1 hypothetical protein [archaeon]MBT7660574.1 hypothetical protein [archaeon]